jgi:phosphoribosylaminoimidazole carboxylase (NCAIR synthetase)
MLNLLGPAGVDLTTSEASFLPTIVGRRFPIVCHWYGKEEIRPGRKLGHLTGLVSSPADLPALSAELDRWHDEWVENLRNLAQSRNA